MKNNLRRWIAFLLSFVIILTSYIPVFSTDTLSSEPTSYSKEYNSGERDVICTSLDGTSADSYYTGNNTYEYWETLSASALQTSLHNLMTSTHTYTSSYDNCRDMANKTDCENEEKNVVLIYTSYSATMSQYNGWNREHVWPQSLGGGNTKGGGADLHHIRPSDAGVNSSRGNKKYGNVDGGTAKYGSDPATGVLGGHYDSTYFEPLDNVKGDVARIILYVWIRWDSAWGATAVTNVFQSVDVLLEWCALDPVDTWEMGRNEVIQEIQGNRNVFIDYPELAWMLFDKEIPFDMTTPSGNASGTPGCSHENQEIKDLKAETCTSAGYTGDVYCTDCERIIKRGETISAINHSNAYVINKVDVTCTANGYSGDKYCPDCNEIIVYGETVLAGHTNTYVVGKVDATCKNEGYTGDTYCRDCGNKVTAGSVIPVTENHVTEVRDAVKEGCSTEGYTGDTYCQICGEKTADGRVIPANGKHTTEIRGVVNETCGADGYTGDTYCKVCEKKISEGQTVPKHGNHSYGEWTLSSDGITYKRYCTVCEAEEIFTMDMALSSIESDAELIVILLALGASNSLLFEALSE